MLGLYCKYVDLRNRMLGPLHISYTSYVAVLNKAVQTSASLAYQWDLHRNVSLKAYVYPCRRKYLSTRIMCYFSSVASFSFMRIIISGDIEVNPGQDYLEEFAGSISGDSNNLK